jgi:hypothetical protein
VKACRSSRTVKKSLGYLVPRRLTLECNPKVVAFLVWNFYNFKEDLKDE